MTNSCCDKVVRRNAYIYGKEGESRTLMSPSTTLFESDKFPVTLAPGPEVFQFSTSGTLKRWDTLCVHLTFEWGIPESGM